MKKYNPTKEDLYNTDPCPVCGDYLLDEQAETCGKWSCVQKWQCFKDDFYAFMCESLFNDTED